MELPALRGLKTAGRGTSVWPRVRPRCGGGGEGVQQSTGLVRVGIRGSGRSRAVQWTVRFAPAAPPGPRPAPRTGRNSQFRLRRGHFYSENWRHFFLCTTRAADQCDLPVSNTVMVSVRRRNLRPQPIKHRSKPALSCLSSCKSSGRAGSQKILAAARRAIRARRKATRSSSPSLAMGDNTDLLADGLAEWPNPAAGPRDGQCCTRRAGERGV